MLPPQDRDLVAQDEDLGVLRGGRSREQREPVEYPAEDQIQQARRHGRPSFLNRPATSPLVNTTSEY
jgi:hypothetical protein